MAARPSRWLVALLAVWVTGSPVRTGAIDPLVFVSRQIPATGSIYWDVPMDLPGVGPHSRFRPASPGRLLVRESDGTIRTLVDGAHPAAAGLNLIDVNAPDVSYDAKTIVFAGLPNGSYSPAPVTNPGAWRLFVINADGSGLRQLTRSDQQLNLKQFGNAGGGLRPYDDTDPAWLPDGRIVFSSTRWPGYAQYSGVRTTNLYVVNADGTGLHRITSERNGADRPEIDPVTGKIVYARWWRNHRFALDDTSTVTDPAGGYVQKDGLSAKRDIELDGTRAFVDFLWRNVWNAATINPDGTELKAWNGSFLQAGDGAAGHMYGGSFTPTGDLLANFFPMLNMTEAAGFGGVRRLRRGPVEHSGVIGVTEPPQAFAHATAPVSFGIGNGPYAADAVALSDGTLALSWAADVTQDYGLYQVRPDGTGLVSLYDNRGTSEVRARPLVPRALPPRLPDTVTHVAAALPPSSAGPYDADGQFTFDALNIYANAPVDTDIVSAPPVGSIASIRFFLDHQRTSAGSFPNLDWPILLEEKPINPDGSVRTQAPANVPLFEQLRTKAGKVPVNRGPSGALGAGHVAGMNFGPSGATATCVGCHVGHTMIQVPDDHTQAVWSNLAPGAQVTVSSTRTSQGVAGLNDRRVRKALPDQIWSSSPGLGARGQWVQLTFPVPVRVRTIKLYSPERGGTGQSTLELGNTVVRLMQDANGTERASRTVSEIQSTGTEVPFGDVVARVVRIEFDRVTGAFFNAPVAALTEVEVIARGEAAP